MPAEKSILNVFEVLVGIEYDGESVVRTFAMTSFLQA